MNYTFHSAGTVSAFNPQKKVTSADGTQRSLLDVHLELVRASGRRDVFVLDQRGREVPVPLTQAA